MHNIKFVLGGGGAVGGNIKRAAPTYIKLMSPNGLTIFFKKRKKKKKGGKSTSTSEVQSIYLFVLRLHSSSEATSSK